MMKFMFGVAKISNPSPWKHQNKQRMVQVWSKTEIEKTQGMTNIKPKWKNKLITICQTYNESNNSFQSNFLINDGLEVEKVPQAEIDDGISDDGNLEDDDVDITELTKKIEKSLSNLDQAEVE